MAELNPKPKFRPRAQISAKALRQLADRTQGQIRGDSTSAVQKYGDRLIVSAPSTPTPTLPGVSNYLRQFVVLLELDDYLVCTPHVVPNDGTLLIPQVYNRSLGAGAIEIYYVVKPFLLQRTPFDGNIVSYPSMDVAYSYTGTGRRTATSQGQVDEDQLITPSYFTADIITARCGPTGYMDLLGNYINWTDTNEGGRQWAVNLA